jgi:hypothetical protein
MSVYRLGEVENPVMLLSGGDTTATEQPIKIRLDVSFLEAKRNSPYPTNPQLNIIAVIGCYSRNAKTDLYISATDGILTHTH